jgi:hypothetical protein
MDQLSPATLAEPCVPVPPSERRGSRLSGTRRVSATGTAAHPPPTAIEAAPEPTAELPAGSAAPARWRVDEQLRRRWLGVSVGAAALAGGAGPLLASSAGGEAAVTCLVMSLSLICLSQAALAWTAPYWQTRVRLDGLGSWLTRKLSLLALDLRTLPRAPKNLALSLTSNWLRGAGLLGLIGAGCLGLGEQVLGLPLAAPVMGLSLAGAALVACSGLLRWARLVQPRGNATATEALALATREFPAVVDASRALEIDTLFLQPTLLHRVMELLPSWREPLRRAGAEGYAASLQHHLWCGLPLSQIERYPGHEASGPDGSAELLIDEALRIFVQVGIDRGRTRALCERLRRQAQCPGAQPSVVVVVEAGVDALLYGDAAEPLRSLHTALPLVVAVLA